MHRVNSDNVHNIIIVWTLVVDLRFSTGYHSPQGAAEGSKRVREMTKRTQKLLRSVRYKGYKLLR